MCTAADARPPLYSSALPPSPCTGTALQRYFMALLTAAHQHNSGAADSAREQPAGGGDSGAAPTEGAAVAPLAAALAGRQLRLSALSAATDVAISAAAGE